MRSEEDKHDTIDAPKISEEFSLGNVHTGLEKIRTRLLDLTARNKLLNFRHPKTSCLRFVDTTLDAVFQHLVEGNTLALEAVPEPHIGARGSANFPLLIKSSQEDQIPAKDYAGELGWKTDFDLYSLDKPPRMRVLAYQDDLDRTAKKITTTARTSIEESGANMLYLCFGFLEWKDSETVQASHAPLLIMPVTIEREKAPRNLGWVYHIQYSSEDLTTNLSLVEKMKRDFAVAVPYLREEDTPTSYAAAVREAVSNRPEWQVKNFLTLSLLSFGKLLMFLDLDPARWPAKARITNHSVIKNLFEGVKASSLTFPDEYRIDDEDLQVSVPRLFYDADSSQHSALIDALNGKNLVIEGPPGTGKSQSITNLIDSALLKGKSVLFIAEKLAALEVVYRRLDAIGLGLFCLELHSHKTQKRELLNGLERRLSARNTFAGAPNLEYKLSQAKETKTQLNKYVRLLNMPHPQFGSTTFDIIWARHRAAMALPGNVPDLDSLMIRDEERLGYRGKVTTAADEANHLMTNLNFPDAAGQDIRGAVQYLKQSSKKVTVGGFCMGGALTILAAVRVPEMDTGACFYGIPPLDAADLKKIKIPLICHFANKDDWCTPAKVNDLEAALKQSKSQFELYRYEAHHAFMNEARPEVYDPACAKTAWERTLKFLKTALA